jgi:hypothetical protein
MDDKLGNLILEKLEKLEQGQAKLEQGQIRLEERHLKLETAVETKIEKNIQLLVEGYSHLAKKVEKIDTMAEDIEYIKIKVDLLDAATRLNSYDIKKLKVVE